ncbi:hypothetical protein FSB78_10470 [Sphingomonas ginsenosidivorax]|uniref:Uncharacterized protein n=1 Tax=Sphingomonas ginsenosidivorax TaxID=862135 RepID=A0A5C6UJL3_9SPHN|nr:hypothetical protein FSB78_10470 [Sphingomonas ginsenosidivorax]
MGDQRSPRWLMFDSWYVCMLVGVRARTLGAKDDLEDAEFNPIYPDDYKPQADFIAGLLIDAELDRKGINVADKASVEREMILLLDPQKTTGLSEIGVELLNRYAVAGFAKLDEVMLPPATVEEMLVRYAGVWTGGED